MRLPDFLLIGAMKCGTTTLFRDLESHPGVFMPEDKEPHALVDDAVLTPRGRARYARLFAPARADQLAGEASTGYSKLPWESGAVERAKELLRPDLRLLYIVRDPIQRIASHHYHLYAGERIGPDINEAVREEPRLIGYTRYGSQIEPWLDAYGSDLVRVVRFESYIEDRPARAAEIFAWMGLDPALAEIRPEESFNVGESRRVPTRLRFILKSRLYREVGRRVLPASLRHGAQRTMLSKAPPRPAPPRPETVDAILEELWPDIEKLSELLALSEPMWERETLRRRHHERYTAHEQTTERGMTR